MNFIKITSGMHDVSPDIYPVHPRWQIQAVVACTPKRTLSSHSKAGRAVIAPCHLSVSARIRGDLVDYSVIAPTSQETPFTKPLIHATYLHAAIEERHDPTSCVLLHRLSLCYSLRLCDCQACQVLGQMTAQRLQLESKD